MSTRILAQVSLAFSFLIANNSVLANSDFSYMAAVGYSAGGIHISGCSNHCQPDIVIPEELDGFVVTGISDIAFANQEISSITLTESITSIGHEAFANNFLYSVAIPDSVTNLEIGAFSNNQLTTVEIPNSILLIRHATFENNQLTSVTIPENITYVESSAFAANALTSIYFNGSRPEIESLAFAFNPDLSLIYYCSGTAGWPGEPIEGITPASMACGHIDGGNGNGNDNGNGNGDVEGITPQLDDSCNISDELNESITYATFDIDQSGSVDALSDGLILLRYFFGLRGDALVNDVISPDANRTSAADIEAYIESHMP